MKIHFAKISLLVVLLFSFTAITVVQKTTAKPAIKKPVAKKPATTTKAPQKLTYTVNAPAPGAGYSNGIKLDVKGFVVREAYLSFEDGTKVPTDNKVDLNQQVSMRMVLTTAFKEVNGKAFPGGSEKIALSTGEVILESQDLFTDYDTVGVSPADAKYITLKAVITDIKDKNNAVIVTFRVWDKKSPDNLITGSYTMHIK